MPAVPNANAVPRHIFPQKFQVVAWDQIEAAPYWERGVCFNPGCCAKFEPRRDWQMYCSGACERAGTAEMRRWGHRLALPSLVDRMGRWIKGDDAIHARTLIARRHVTELKTAWLSERREKIEGAQNVR